MPPLRLKNKSHRTDDNYMIISIPLEHKTLPINGYQYTFDKKLGNGAFGAVYAARQHPHDKLVAIKVVSLATRSTTKSLQNSKSVLTEIHMSQRLAQTSKHIIHMYDFDFHQTGLSFLVMELGQQDLEKYLSTRSFLLPTERKSIWRQLVDIAVTLHNNQIVHRDIKPQNLIVFSGNVVKLGDLGIAQKSYRNKTGPNGTPRYSAPEVTSPYPKVTITTKADVWSWGAVLYRMTYMAHPDYNEPCYHPPINQRSTRDEHLHSILRHTLVINPNGRPSPSWFLRHPYTTIS